MKNSDVDPLRDNPGIARGAAKYGPVENSDEDEGDVDNPAAWLRQVAAASGKPLEEVQSKWREHVRTVAADGKARMREFLSWYDLKGPRP